MQPSALATDKAIKQAPGSIRRENTLAITVARLRFMLAR